jgi:hypothetical protein
MGGFIAAGNAERLLFSFTAGLRNFVHLGGGVLHKGKAL